jgi:hypothetical protein
MEREIDKMVEEALKDKGFMNMAKEAADILRALNSHGEDGFSFGDVVKDPAARAVVGFIMDTRLPKDCPAKDAFLNGLVLGVFLSELGRAQFITREKGKEEEVVILGDLSGNCIVGEV